MLLSGIIAVLVYFAILLARRKRSLHQIKIPLSACGAAAVLLLLMALILSGTQSEPDMEAPDFSLEDLEGNTWKLSELEDYTVVLNFWATWCPPCRSEFPDFSEFNAETDDSVLLLKINLTASEEDIQSVREFIEARDAAYPVLLDREGEAAQLFEVQSIPLTWFISPGGRVARIHRGPISLRELRSGLRAAEGP